MSFISDLYTYLAAQSEITDLVSTRIYPRMAPAGASRPLIVYSQVSGFKNHNMAGSGVLAVKRIQFDILADTALSAEAVEEALRDQLDTYRGTFGSTEVRDCFITNELDGFDNPITGDEIPTYRRMIEYQVWYNETASSV